LTLPQPPAPRREALERLLLAHAPLAPSPLCPELLVHNARSLVDVWEAAERVAGCPLPAPFWAYPWPGGSALARVLLDSPDLVRGRSVVDFGAGGGVAALAAARAGAAEVVANDIDPWALLVTEIAAAAQQLCVGVLSDDLCATPALADDFDVVLCSDLAYERSETPRQRLVLQRAVRQGATVLVADAGRKYFDPSGMHQIGEHEVAVPHDLEGVALRTARVYLMGG
jgi:predicted nicotinamide N-methyase